MVSISSGRMAQSQGQRSARKAARRPLHRGLENHPIVSKRNIRDGESRVNEYGATLTVGARRIYVLTQRVARDSLRPMSAVRVAPGRWLNPVLTMTGLLLIVYFSYHALAGNRGWFALQDLRERRDALSVELSAVREDRARFERRVDLLDRDHIDADLLEESARSTLGYAEPDDLVIYRGR